MKPTKKLLNAISEIDLPKYVIEQLSDNTEIIGTLLKRGCKPPHLKTGENYKNTKTKYGLLYTTFNNAKTKHNLPNYDDRYDFIDKYMSDKKFVKLFKAYKKSGFARQLKPSLHVISPMAEFPLSSFNIEFITYGELMKKSSLTNAVRVTAFKGNNPRRLYDSIGEASRHTGNSTTTIRHYLKQKRGKFRYTTQEHINHIEAVRAQVKKDKNKMGVKI